MAKDQEERLSVDRKRINEGLLGACYTQKGWFVKIKPCLSIDKIKFAFVKMNSKGSGFDVYCDIPKFDLLCDDILAFRLERKIEQEKALQVSDPKNHQNPTSWVHKTGEKASKFVRIGAGKSGVLIQGGKAGEDNQFANVPCAYDDLRIIAKWFKRVSARWFDEATSVIIENSNTDRFHNVTAEDESAIGYEDADTDEAPVVEPVKASIKILKEFSRNGNSYRASAYDEGNKRNVTAIFGPDAVKIIEKKLPMAEFTKRYVGNSLIVKADMVKSGNEYEYDVIGLGR